MGFEKLGKYLLLEKRSDLGSTEIFLAKSNVADGLNKFFLIKRELRSQSRRDPPALNHNNILTVFDSGIEAQYAYTVMDYFESYSLKSILMDFKKARCFLSVDQILYVTREMAAGLNVAHSLGFCGTVNLQNSLIGLDGSVKLTEFSSEAGRPEDDLASLQLLFSEILGDKKHSTSELELLSAKKFAAASDMYREINRYLNMQFPDFSSHDFGDLLTQFYGQSVTQQRQRLREYANSEIGQAENESVPDIYERPEKTVTTTSITKSTELPEGFTSVPVNAKISNSEFKFETLNKVNPFAALPQPTKRAMPNFRPKAQTPSQNKDSDEIPSRPIITDVMLLVAVGLLLTQIGYVYNMTIKRYSRKMVESMDTSTLPIETLSQNSLKTLRANHQLAYLNIRVEGPSSDTRIFINGKELLEKSPVKMYPVFANEETVVSVLNQRTQKFAVKKVRGNTGAVINVLLNVKN